MRLYESVIGKKVICSYCKTEETLTSEGSNYICANCGSRNIIERKSPWKPIGIFLFVVLAGLGAIFDQEDNGSNKSGRSLEIGSTYAFFGSGCDFQCYECDPDWKIKFIDSQNAELWSHSSRNDNLKSCMSSVKYSFNDDVITIISINNSNISSECKSGIKGSYKYDTSRKLFVSMLNPKCNFTWYK